MDDRGFVERMLGRDEAERLGALPSDSSNHPPPAVSPSVILKVGPMTAEQREEFSRRWEAEYLGTTYGCHILTGTA
jgi:hypothetical protein